MSDSDWTLLTVFDNDVEAHIVQGFLESEGIETVLENEMFSRIYPIGFNSIGGIRMMVPSDDYARAVELIQNRPEGQE